MELCCIKRPTSALKGGRLRAPMRQPCGSLSIGQFGDEEDPTTLRFAFMQVTSLQARFLQLDRYKDLNKRWGACWFCDPCGVWALAKLLEPRNPRRMAPFQPSSLERIVRVAQPRLRQSDSLVMLLFFVSKLCPR